MNQLGNGTCMYSTNLEHVFQPGALSTAPTETAVCAQSDGVRRWGGATAPGHPPGRRSAHQRTHAAPESTSTFQVT